MVIFDGQRNKKKLTPVCNVMDNNSELNNIEMSPQLVVQLYKNSFIETSEEHGKFHTKSNSEDVKLKFLGNNDKNILLIVNYRDAVHLPDDQLDFLINMLSACKLGITDVSIVNMNNNPELNYKNAIDFFNSRIIILFGVEPSDLSLPVSFPHFQVQQFSGRTYLFTPPLQEINHDNVIKSKVWVCLRRVFGI